MFALNPKLIFQWKNFSSVDCECFPFSHCKNHQETDEIECDTDTEYVDNAFDKSRECDCESLFFLYIPFEAYMSKESSCFY